MGLELQRRFFLSSQVFFNNNTVSNVERGFVHSAAADISITGNSLSASNQAISVQRQFTSAGVIEAIGGLNNIDATVGNTINGVAIAGATLPQLYAIEDAIYHKVDSCLFGLVRVVNDNLYVTPNSGSIQCGIDASTSGDILYVKNGMYAENLLLEKQLDMRGNNYGINPNTDQESQRQSLCLPHRILIRSVLLQ